MDTRTEVERRTLPNLSRIATSPVPTLGGTMPEGALVWKTAGQEGYVGDAKVSIDPLRATDRYRLVMPYVARV